MDPDQEGVPEQSARVATRPAVTELQRLRRRWAIGGSVVLMLVVGLWIKSALGGPEPSRSSASSTNGNCLTASQSWNEIGQTACVQFTVGSVYTSASGQHYLDQYSDYASGFSVWIPSNYSFGQGLVGQYNGDRVDVTGTITSYDGAQQIEVTDPSQIHQDQ